MVLEPLGQAVIRIAGFDTNPSERSMICIHIPIAKAATPTQINHIKNEATTISIFRCAYPGGGFTIGLILDVATSTVEFLN
jgi:hypothetical protein